MAEPGTAVLWATGSDALLGAARTDATETEVHSAASGTVAMHVE